MVSVHASFVMQSVLWEILCGIALPLSAYQLWIEKSAAFPLQRWSMPWVSHRVIFISVLLSCIRAIDPFGAYGGYISNFTAVTVKEYIKLIYNYIIYIYTVSFSFFFFNFFRNIFCYSLSNKALVRNPLITQIYYIYGIAYIIYYWIHSRASEQVIFSKIIAFCCPQLGGAFFLYYRFAETGRFELDASRR